MTSSNPLTFFTYSPSQIPIFEGEHYEYWSSQMETIFISQDLWDVVKQEFKTVAEEETEKQLKENIKKNATALRIIQQGVSKSIYPRIFGMKSAQEAWDVLKKEFKGDDKVISIKLQNYWRNFDNLSMKENESVKDFSSRVDEIVNQIKGCGDTISEKKVVERILRSLPQKSSISLPANGYTNQPLEQVFQVKANLGEKKSDARQEERGYSSSYRGSSSRRRGGSGQNHGRGYGRKPSLDVQRSGTECQICKKPGHESKSCWHRCTSYKETWFLDSGCSHHITGNRDSFAMLDDKFSTQVELGDSKRVSIEGQGVVAVFTEGGNKKHIHDVYYSSKITHNLLSVGQIMKDGYKLIFDNDRCDIINKKNNLRVAAVKMNANGLFPFETGKLQTYALKCGDLDESYLWHLREKFDEKGEKLIFIGYTDESKGYRIYNPKTNQLVLSRDVIFDELAVWNWDDNDSQVPVLSDGAETIPFADVAGPTVGTQSRMEGESLSTEGESSSTTAPTDDSESDSPQRYRSLSDIYSETNLALFAGEPQNYQEDDSEMADEKLYRSLVGSLIYLTNTRPDIVHPVSVLSRFMSKPSKVHYAAAKRVLRFLQGTMKHGLRYVKESNNDLVGFTDSDWASSLEDRRSTSAYLFCLGSKVISWSSRKQNTVALSSVEAEYSAGTSAACEVVWLRRIMADLQQKHTQNKPLDAIERTAAAGSGRWEPAAPASGRRQPQGAAGGRRVPLAGAGGRRVPLAPACSRKVPHRGRRRPQEAGASRRRPQEPVAGSRSPSPAAGSRRRPLVMRVDGETTNLESGEKRGKRRRA
ncbi:hypothetical protein ZIOFF_048446 [Zingiber officinale]|uniref:Uncharacterized protein n=1 Tax=Zingiber officinale TaxID=94328 RepID=A0A8J5KUB6_ZINOF|nr:hypothetical protein ZIOFF_048446 [Zingiber officinale]